MEDAARPVPSSKAFEIKALSTRRRQIVEMAAMEKTRLKQTLDEAVAASCRMMIDHLTQERASIEAQMDQMMSDPVDQESRRLLQTIPGVGPAVSLTLLADMPELGGLNRKSAASLAGLAPHADESGTRTGAARISGGRPCVRAALYMAAISAVRTDKGFRQEYLALRAAGKPAKVALVAVARRIVAAANSILKSRKARDPHA
jgi:transposase